VRHNLLSQFRHNNLLSLSDSERPVHLLTILHPLCACSTPFLCSLTQKW